ncbi:MAG: quinone-dependent dihydroorotate dehydrogenase [Micrococcales bacterium]|nr:quinone-dependent dihydroorotate dehydrogenase [Micrococcales bacterium]
MYHALFRRFFVKLDPERAHHLAMVMLRMGAVFPPLRAGLQAVLARRGGAGLTVFGRRLPGPLGVAAGFDKDAKAIRALTMGGFSFIEGGTLTPKPQPGNDRPRVWRLVEQRALRNKMGFNNGGAAKAARRLRRLRRSRSGRDLMVGGNIGKNMVTALADAPQDYRTSAALLAPWVDYLAVNVSSPNTPGLRELQAPEALAPVLRATVAGAREGLARVGNRGEVPVLVKLAPDLSDAEITAIATLTMDLGLAGVVAVNTTADHQMGEGGLSGPLLKKRGVAVVRLLRQVMGPDAVIMGVGGVTTAQDITDYLMAGATVVQAFTAFIYEGPAWAARIQRQAAKHSTLPA